MNTGVWQEYNGLIYDRRTDGLSLRQLGKEFGVSYERIRQILDKYYGTTKIQNRYTAKEAARIFQVNYGWLCRILLKIKDKQSKRQWGTWSFNEIQKAIIRSLKYCKFCGSVITPGSGQHIFDCPECYKKYYRHRYFYWTEEQKQRHKEMCYDWINRNLEYKHLMDRKRSYEHTQKRVQDTLYRIVARDNIIPYYLCLNGKGTTGKREILFDYNGVEVPLRLNQVRVLRRI